MEVGIEPEQLRARANVGERRACRLLHDVAELAGERQVAFPARERHFSGKNLATNLGPCQSGGQSDLALVVDLLRAEFRFAQKLLHFGSIDIQFEALALLDHLAGDLPKAGADLALEAADAGLARIGVDQLLQGSGVEFDLRLFQSLLSDLFRHEELPPDGQLFQMRVAGKEDDLHAILERRRDGVDHVRRGDEHDLRQVVLHVEVVIGECIVLLRIEYLEQRRRRISSEIHRHLVHFVEQEHRIDRSRLLHPLNDLAGERADVRPPMTADLGFIAHAAQRQPHEAAPGCAGDRLRQ